MSSKKHNKSTIIIRNLPTDALRSEVEDLFSDIGPIKKCSLIRDEISGTCKGFGFVRFVSEEDAQAAVKQASNGNGFVLNRSSGSLNLSVELTSSTPSSKPEGGQISNRISGSERDSHEPDDHETSLKRTSRVIIRNLAFTAKKSHIESECSKFGKVVDIHLPIVTNGKIKQHRGFAFVTFENPQFARLAIAASEVSIKGRQVAIDLSMPKSKHQAQKEHQHAESDEHHKANLDQEQNENGDKDNDDGNDSVSSTKSRTSDSSRDESESSQAVSVEDENEENTLQVLDDVKEQCTIFVRNIPFDVDRHDLFMLFKKFGRIDGIYIVKDKATNVMKGTAFIKFTNAASTKRALEAGKAQEDTPFVTGKDMLSNQAENDESDGIFIHGRRLLINLAVDRDTAGTLRVERDENGKAIKKMGKDRRNLYLKLEGYIGNDERNSNAWRHIPEIDKEKRARASTEKSTKLRSPLFFINPHRLSIRNLGKHVDEASLKKLIVSSIKEGLGRKLVAQEDIVSQLRAQGLPPRECVGEASKIPEFDEKDIRSYVPSVFIGREVITSSATKRAELGPSKGFAFIEFTYHAHALSCLRELNNNPKYSEDWVIFGKKVAEAKKTGKKGGLQAGFFNEEGKLLIPRLIVDFTVSVLLSLTY